MLVELQQSDVRDSGTFSRAPSTFTADTITIGRGTDQLVQINCRQLSLAHCSISRTSDGQFEISGSAALSINGHSSRGKILKSGDTVRLAGAEIDISIPSDSPGDGQPSITLHVRHIDQSDAKALSKVRATSLEHTWLRPRRFAWLLFLAITVFTVVIPYLHSFGLPSALQKQLPESVKPSAAFLIDELQSNDWLPTHALWNSGPLADAHQHFAGDCESCHAAPFQPTTVAACMECHSTTGVHSNKPEAGFQVADNKACNSCHVDHNGGGLVRASQQKCVDCHGNISATSLGMSELPNVFDFDSSHPEFSLPIYRHQDGQWEATHRQLGAAGSTEASGIQFSHQFHLQELERSNPATATDQPACLSCHQPDHSGGFGDIVMEEHCQSCHSLSFDTDIPEFQAPHQDIETVVQTIETWYQRKQLKGESLGGERVSIRPGQTSAAPSVLDAQSHADKVASSLIERESCVQCHRIENPSAPLRQRHVEPVWLQSTWLNSNAFDHRKHRDVDCVECHNAPASSQSADILIPSINDCQTCHFGENSRVELENHQRQNNCLDCHSYHQAPRVLSNATVEQ